MFRSAFFGLGLLFSAAPVLASDYSATLAAPADGRFIAHDITWNCGGASCQGTTDESRPVVLCQSLAKRAGRVESFLADGHVITAAELKRCNASAKPQPDKALAAK